MKQEIRHGATLETATPAEVARIVAAELDTRQVTDYTRRKDIITLDGTGAGQAKLNVSSQYDWRLERITIAGAGAVSALVEFYENQIAPLDLLEVVQLGATGLYSDSFDNTLYLPANSQLFVAVTGGVASLQVTYNLQIRQLHRG